VRSSASCADRQSAQASCSLAGNYAKPSSERRHAAERKRRFPTFMKPSEHDAAHPATDSDPPRCSPDQIDIGCELVVVIGRHCRGVTEFDALDYVPGYTFVNDIRTELQAHPGRTQRGVDKFVVPGCTASGTTLLPEWAPCILSADAVLDRGLPIKLTVNARST